MLKVDPMSRTLKKGAKLLKADFSILQESAFLNSIDNGNYYNNLYNYRLCL